MRVRVFVTARFQRSFEALEPGVRARVRQALDAIRADPLVGKALKDPLSGEFSHRVGAYRIIYTYDPEQRAVWLETVRHRYLRELARRTGQSLRAVQHELPRLERLGLVVVRRRWRQKLYRANEQHPLYPELKRIVYKTAGLGDVLRESLTGLEGVEAAFVYGSVAKGRERAGSDVDLTGDRLSRSHPAARGHTTGGRDAGPRGEPRDDGSRRVAEQARVRRCLRRRAPEVGEDLPDRR